METNTDKALREKSEHNDTLSSLVLEHQLSNGGNKGSWIATLYLPEEHKDKQLEEIKQLYLGRVIVDGQTNIQYSIIGIQNFRYLVDPQKPPHVGLLLKEIF